MFWFMLILSVIFDETININSVANHEEQIHHLTTGTLQITGGTQSSETLVVSGASRKYVKKACSLNAFMWFAVSGKALDHPAIGASPQFADCCCL